MRAISWCTSDTKKSIPCCMPFGDLPETVYLLNPFGEPYKESFYEGYGYFGGRDVYELLVEWNRDYLTAENISMPMRSNYSKGISGSCYYKQAVDRYSVLIDAIREYASGASDDYMKENYGKVLGSGTASDWKRGLGIAIACDDEHLVKLPYPVKIVEYPISYKKADISPQCPFQGFFYPDSLAAIHNGVHEAFERLEMYVAQRQKKSTLNSKI